MLRNTWMAANREYKNRITKFTHAVITVNKPIGPRADSGLVSEMAAQGVLTSFLSLLAVSHFNNNIPSSKLPKST